MPSTAAPPAARAPARELSGITPSGPLTLGNYLGALRRFRGRQDNGFYFVANLHALTTGHDPERLRRLTLSTAALFLASGLDPDRATVFLQSDVHAHAELGHLLESAARVGELSRMIQFREKGGRPGTRASLFTYPCLMAADILLYETAHVPVGGDQSQHVELARDLAERFNAAYGPTFVVPDLAPAAIAASVRDLADPATKMSKSAPDEAAGVIRMLDPPGVILRKVRRAVTDSDGDMRYDPESKPGLSNLAEILSALTGESPGAVMASCRRYADLKQVCADAIDGELAPIRRRHDELMSDPAELLRTLARGAERAARSAQPVLRRARAAIGLVSCPAASSPAAAGAVIRLGEDDAGEILTLRRAAYVTEAQAHDDVRLPPLCETMEDLKAELGDRQVLALGIRDGRGRLVAAVRARAAGPVADVGRLAVAPDRQGQGLGSRLLSAVEARLPGSVTELRLFTGERSQRSLRLYARLGYTETGTAPTARGYRLVHMRKPRSAAGGEPAGDRPRAGPRP